MNKKLYPEHRELYGWSFYKNLDDFLIVADNLENEEGPESSRARVIRYLVARLKEAEKIAD